MNPPFKYFFVKIPKTQKKVSNSFPFVLEAFNKIWYFQISTTTTPGRSPMAIDGGQPSQIFTKNSRNTSIDPIIPNPRLVFHETTSNLLKWCWPTGLILSYLPIPSSNGAQILTMPSSFPSQLWSPSKCPQTKNPWSTMDSLCFVLYLVSIFWIWLHYGSLQGCGRVRLGVARHLGSRF